ncbi:MAG: M6 family metalloprotease domain-containing protein [Dysgonamonadaceae bacterium]
MSFPDRPFEKTQNEFHNLMNQSGYSEGNAIGSVRDFYLENSYNQLNLNITVVGPYTANYNMVYYGGNINNIRGNDIRPQDLIKEALAKANPDVNYADFDSDNDGVVDAVHVIYAGYAESAGGPAESIWPHKWTLSNVSYDGKRITAYSCSSELRWSSGSKIAAIGTTCHELGHVFGAPDFYDTNTRDLITWPGTSSWDLMAIGNWNNGGDWPAHHNPYTKSQIFGWSEIKNFPADNTLITLNPASASNNSFYRLNTSTPNEYFIIENRQPVGFDMGLPGHGMLVYHVHSQFDPNSQDNNITHPQRFYPICASAAQNPTNTPASYGDINSGGCPFPGTFNRRSLTFNTMPSLRSWAGANTRKNIQFITETGNNITFVVNPTISGPSNICDQATYTIENLPAGTPLAWSVSSDIRVISEQNTSIIVERDPTLLYMYPTSYILVDIGEPINMILEHNLIVWKGGINETTDLIDISSSPDEYGNPYIHTAQLKGDMLYSGLKESPQWSVSEGLNLTFTDGTMMQFEGYLSQGKYIAVELINPCDEATQIVHRFNNNMSEYSSPDLSILVRHSQFKILDKFRNNTRTEKK